MKHVKLLCGLRLDEPLAQQHQIDEVSAVENSS
jgi:hypothetical protein